MGEQSSAGRAAKTMQEIGSRESIANAQSRKQSSLVCWMGFKSDRMLASQNVDFLVECSHGPGAVSPCEGRAVNKGPGKAPEHQVSGCLNTCPVHTAHTS